MGLMFVCGEEWQKIARTTRLEKEGAQAVGKIGIVDYIHREGKKVNVARCRDRTHLGVKGVVVEGNEEKGEDRPHRETEQKLHGREKGK